MAEQDQKKETEAHKPLERLRFHYIKANQFRVIHVDGAYGGVTPRGLIHMSFYSERYPIPQVTAHYITAEGQLGDEIPEERVSRDGPIREIEVGVVIDVTTARALVEWLNEKIKLIETTQKAPVRGE